MGYAVPVVVAVDRIHPCQDVGAVIEGTNIVGMPWYNGYRALERYAGPRAGFGDSRGG